MTEEETKELIKHLRKVALGPNDVIMYSTERILVFEEAQRIHQALRRAFPGNDVIIVDQAGKIEVISPQEVPS